MDNKLHFWVGNGIGYVFNDYPVPPYSGFKGRWKYLGFTFDNAWPKKMNTGRILYKPSSKSMKKTNRYRKTLTQHQKN